MTKETHYTQHTAEFAPKDFGLIGEAMIDKLHCTIARKERKAAFAGISQMLYGTRLVPRTAVIQSITVGCNLNGTSVLVVQYEDRIPIVSPPETEK